MIVLQYIPWKTRHAENTFIRIKQVQYFFSTQCHVCLNNIKMSHATTKRLPWGSYEMIVEEYQTGNGCKFKHYCFYNLNETCYKVVTSSPDNNVFACLVADFLTCSNILIFIQQPSTSQQLDIHKAVATCQTNKTCRQVATGAKKGDRRPKKFVFAPQLKSR